MYIRTQRALVVGMSVYKIIKIGKDQPTIILHLVGIVIGLTTCAVISGMGRMLVLLTRISGTMSRMLGGTTRSPFLFSA